jgi:pyridoxal phosphate enzyme (YggS family)
VSEGSRRRELEQGLAGVRARLARACEASGRDPAGVTLVAVTKTFPASDCALLQELGVLDLGENRDTEARAKAQAVPGVRWHFVGRLQSNKARSVASYAHLVHGLDRASLVGPLEDGAAAHGRVLGVLVQVSLDGDPRRGGAQREEVAALAAQVAGSAHLRLAGVMAVAPLGADPAGAFALLAHVALELQQTHPDAVLVSAGMSGDLEQAVAAGATHVRVGSAILGGRSVPLG